MTTTNVQRRDEDGISKTLPVILIAATQIIRGVNFAIKNMKIINEVERDSGQPFEEIVRLHAKEMQVTMHEASVLLGYASHSAFIRLCRKRGWDKWFAGNKPRKAERVYSRKHSMGSPSAIYLELDGITDTLAGHARRLGIPINTVYGRQARRPGDWSYVFCKVKHAAPQRMCKPAAWKK